MKPPFQAAAQQSGGQVERQIERDLTRGQVMAAAGGHDEILAVFLDAIDQATRPQIAPHRREPFAQPFGQGLHPAFGPAHPGAIGFQAGGGVGERDGLGSGLRGVLQEHGDERPEGGVVVNAQQSHHVGHRQ